MPDAVLALNAGSSSIKFALYEIELDGIRLRLRGAIEDSPKYGRLLVHDSGGRVAADVQIPKGAAGFQRALDWIKSNALSQVRLLAAGHRVVHGGSAFSSPVFLDPTVVHRLAALSALAPLHQLRSLSPYDDIAAFWPDLPQFGVFDTAFHRTISPPANIYALPREYQESGVRKYGFHGLSYEYIAAEVTGQFQLAADARIVAAHLGNGASLCAMQAGASVDTTMGMSTLDGLVMGTRCGTLDPGVVIYLQQAFGKTLDEVQQLLYQRSGLLGVSGLSSDMRVLLDSEDHRAKQAIDLFVFRVAREAAAMAASLGGLDAFIFTGGIGANSSQVRSLVCRRLAWLGVELDEGANVRGDPRLSAAGAKVAVYAVTADEELMIARHTLRMLKGGASGC